MKKLTFIIIAIILTVNLSAQEKPRKFDFKIGSGIGFMGSGDAMTLCLENELDYKLSNYFSTSIGIGIGRTSVSETRHNDYLQGSLNVFISPFRNDKRNNFRVGVGYTRINESITYLTYREQTTNIYHYFYNTINGFNLILENDYQITSRFLLGGKLFVTGGIYEGGVVSGAMIKFGIVL
ncbi:MAG: hypothetical protein JW857_05460 [Bacteroidales bacterium]|nr:hypothetical protein [Bacteroidales bacterium]